METFCTVPTFIRVQTLACATLVNALAACGGSDANTRSAAGGDGDVQQAGAGNQPSPTREEPINCDVEGESIQRLSPEPGADAWNFQIGGGAVFISLETGLYRAPLGDASNAGMDRLVESAGSLIRTDEQVGFLQNMDGSVEVRWFPFSGGEGDSQPLPAAARGNWSYDSGRNSFFAVTSESPFEYLSHDLTSGETQELATDLERASTPSVQYTSAAIIVSSTESGITKLYRIDKGTTTAVELATGLMERFFLHEVDERNAYLTLDANTGVEPGLYRMPLDGSGTATRITELAGSTLLMGVHATPAGTFAEDTTTSREFATLGQSVTSIYQVGPDAVSEATAVVQTGCGPSEKMVAYEGRLYMSVDPSSDYWLLGVPLPP